MRTDIWVGVVIVAGAVGLLTFVLARWRRLPRRVAPTLASLAGGALGAGALLLQDAPGPADWVVTLGILTAFTPVHLRMLVGRPGQAS